MKLVFATNNVNKLTEVQKMLPHYITLLSLKDIGCFDVIEETGNTLHENAKIKSDFITKKFGYDCFSDDTGLEVESLNGAPGVFSARYAENEKGVTNIEKLLHQLKTKSNRNAEFKTVISLNLGRTNFLFEGGCKGIILDKKQGKKGFGYDSIFQPNGFKKSFAQITSEQKNAISHRGKAIEKLILFLKSID